MNVPIQTDARMASVSTQMDHIGANAPLDMCLQEMNVQVCYNVTIIKRECVCNESILRDPFVT